MTTGIPSQAFACPARRAILAAATFMALLGSSQAQAPRTMSSSDIAVGIRKLNVLGSVLYVAAHPDDENTRLIAYLAKEKLYRTGYLSMTRGDGGQNLIGEEQGVELGLIRSQELLAARRVDGGEQFFTRAFDFGFSKSTTEALETWGREKILSDAVWVIRRFQPDVIVTRFPEDSRAGHGHHSASGVIAREAFIAAADPSRFPEQFKHGVKPWQAKRILWNTFNFGGTNTTSENQFRIDVGGYLPLLGKSLGEISAESRSQHKSQGFGVPSSRGASFEYFTPVLGEPVSRDLMDGVDLTWSRVPGAAALKARIEKLEKEFDFRDPSASVKGLAALYAEIGALPPSVYRDDKLRDVAALIESASGLYLEASTNSPYAVRGDSLSVNMQAVNRSGAAVRWRSVALDGLDTAIDRRLENNRVSTYPHRFRVPSERSLTQPYWLVEEMQKGSFTVSDQRLIGKPWNDPAYEAVFRLDVEGVPVVYRKPVLYKSTDPVKGELFQPLYVVPPVSVNTSPGVLLFKKDSREARQFQLSTTAYSRIEPAEANLSYRYGTVLERKRDTAFRYARGQTRTFSLPLNSGNLGGTSKDRLLPTVEYRNKSLDQADYLALAQIDYDHIPSIRYFYPDGVTLLNIPLQVRGRKVGYIKGAGDKVPEALQEMGFEVTYLGENDMEAATLKQFDAIVAGVRAYNVHEWLFSRQEALSEYVASGGNFVVQYNTNSSFGPVKSRIGPVPFNISRSRTTDENSTVRFLDPADPILNNPNRITSADFEGWVQERGIYFAEMPAARFRPVLAMRDPGETDDLLGSLIVANHGKGRFIYTGLVFFRQLPAGVPGAYRLFANLVSNPNATKDGNGK
jgi:LmbE family N-acetylglucosaminyl deacetylase